MLDDVNGDFLTDALEKFCAEYEAEIEKLKNELNVKNNLIYGLEEENERRKKQTKRLIQIIKEKERLIHIYEQDLQDVNERICLISQLIREIK